MSLIDQLSNIFLRERRAISIDKDKPKEFITGDDPKKLIARDNTTVASLQIPNIDESTVSEEGLDTFFPKQMNWLNWEDKGFRNALLDAQVWTESRGNPNAVSPVGAAGLAQFMPITWKGAKRRGWIPKDAQVTDPVASVRAQKEYMTFLYNRPAMKSSDTDEERFAKTLASYNAGYGKVLKAIKRASNEGGYWLDYMRNETKRYVPQIMGNAEREYFKNKEDYVSKYKRD